jgi:hypothetical protein
MKPFVTLVVCLFIGQWSLAQKINKADVPDAVLKTFESRMTDSLSVSWEKKDMNYFARFTKNNLHAVMQIAGNSDWILTQWDIPSEYLPKKLKDYLKEKYASYKIVNSKIEYKPGAEFYLVTVKRKKMVQVLRFSVKSEFIGIEPASVPEKAKNKSIPGRKTQE